MGTTAQFRFVEELPEQTYRAVATVFVPRDGAIAADVMYDFVGHYTLGCYDGHGDFRGMGRYAIDFIKALELNGLEPELIAYERERKETYVYVMHGPRIWAGPPVYPAVEVDTHSV